MNSLLHDFYVDDFIKSYPLTEVAKSSVKAVTGLCKSGGFNLRNFISNAPECLSELPSPNVKSDLAAFDLPSDSSISERLSDVVWDIPSDSFIFKIKLKPSPLTKRDLLSSISSTYDPIGIMSPFLLLGRCLFQQLSKLGWDSPLSPQIISDWNSWKDSLPLLESFRLPRCFKPPNFGKPVNVTVHRFSDASENGYGHCSYLRIVDEGGSIHCSFLYGRSRVAPVKRMSIPRLELQAATLSAKMSNFVSNELDLVVNSQYFWTDSMIVLGYIKNISKRFKLFVANRISLINEHTNSNDWFYVVLKFQK